MSVVESINRDPSFSLIEHRSEAESGIEWCFMHQTPRPGYRPCFSEPLLVEMRECQRQIAARMANEPASNGEIRHLVLASKADVFNLGGDLELFSRLIRSGDRARLLAYAQLCVSVAFHFARLADDRVHSVAVVQGDALGGGFEAALCCHTIIAEEGTGMGFPEVLFDLFPGMGAYTFLSRRVTPAQAERMMLDGNIYSSEELFRMGVVDMLVPREHVEFIEGFEDQIIIGDYVFVHAGIRPGVPLSDQKPSDMRWIREEFIDQRGDLEKVVVYGHTIYEDVEERGSRIGIDTGAYDTGKLTALALEGGERWFLQT